ncbi:MAG: TusE/DsrC/DsvC family sulfur relay protein [Hydrogenophilaceae bacterium]|nr:TusE/DsrC/DsvC family sulfur relay protein [Hydrogenophilaceae bacterium]
MMHVSADINRLTRDRDVDPDFPHAPMDWTREEALEIARKENLTMSEAHWEAIRALQSYFASHEDEKSIHLRELHDALDEHFHVQGGLKYLYTLFPGGPVAQGCRIAGLKAPFIAKDSSFGSVS